MSIDEEVYEYLAIPCITTDISNNDVDYPLLRWIFTAHDPLLVPPVLTSIESNTHYPLRFGSLSTLFLYFDQAVSISPPVKVQGVKLVEVVKRMESQEITDF